MPILKNRIQATLILSLTMVIVLLFSASSLASKTYKPFGPEKGALVLSVTGNGLDINFDEGIGLSAKADISLTLDYAKWKHSFSGTLIASNNELPAYDLLKLDRLGFYFEQWRLTSTHDKLTINAGNTYTPTPFNRYMYTTYLYGGSGQISFQLPDTLKDITSTIYVMGGKNQHRKLITETILSIGGITLELDYLKKLKYEAQYMVGKNPTLDIQLGSSKFSYTFANSVLSLDGALSEEKNKEKKGWQGVLGFSTTFENKNKLNTNITYSSSGFTKITPYPSYVGGVLSVGSDLAILLKPVMPGTQTLTLRAKVSKDNIEKLNPSNQYITEAGFTYSASGFAPSSSGYITYALTRTLNDAKPKTVNQTRHSLVLSYIYRATEGKSTFNSSFYINPQITLYHLTENIYLYLYEKGSFTLASERSQLSGTSEITFYGYKNSGAITSIPALILSTSTDIPNTKLTLSASGRLSGKTTYNYKTGIYTLDAYALELTPEIALKISENFTAKLRYLAKLAYGHTETTPGWSGRIGLGLGFRI